MIKMTKQEALDKCRNDNTQFFKGNSGKTTAPDYTPEQSERQAIKLALEDGEIHPKRARIELRKIRLKYNDQR